MYAKENEMCRFCFETGENEFEIIDNVMKEVMEILLFDINFDLEEIQFMCGSCVNLAKKCLYFKLTYLATEKRLLSYACYRKKPELNLEDVFEENHRTTIRERLNVCRLCMSPMEKNKSPKFSSMRIEDVFDILPEVSLKLTQDPIICTSCRDNLDCYCKFLTKCSYVQREINTRYKKEAIGENQTHTERLLFKGISEDDIKQEPSTFEDTDCEEYDETTAVKADLEIYEEKLNILKEKSLISHEASADTSISIKTLKCTSCSYKTNSKHSLKRHNLIHMDISERNKYQCSSCAYKTAYKSAFDRHILSHTNDGMEIYRCSTCSYKTTHKTHVKKHLKQIHKEGFIVYGCTFCPYTAKKKCYLMSHLLVHGVSGSNTHECTFCTYKTTQKSALDIHLLVHKDVPDEEMHACLLCSYKTKLKKSLKSHSLIHENVSNLEMYKCTYCSYENKRKATLHKHMLIHTGNPEKQLHECLSCAYKTKERRNIKQHVLIHRKPAAPVKYWCPSCEFKTRRKTELKKHLVAHRLASPKTFKCTICCFQADQRGALLTHLSVHTDDSKGVQCPSCPFQTKYKMELRAHIIRVHADTSVEKVYSCSSCSYTTKQEHLFNLHVLTAHKSSLFKRKTV